MWGILSSLIANKVILSSAIACAVSQLVKLSVDIVVNRRFLANLLWSVGGMPSAHAAVVSAMALSAYLLEGVSTLSAIMLIIAIIFIRDALGVRMTVQKQSRILKGMTPAATGLRHLEGHTLLETVIGIVVGVGCALLAHVL